MHGRRVGFKSHLFASKEKGEIMKSEEVLKELKKWLKKEEEKCRQGEKWDHIRLFPSEVFKEIKRLEKK